MAKPMKVEIPQELIPYLDNDPEKKVTLLLIFELYREEKLSLRQAAEILKISYREMEDLLKQNKVYIPFGSADLEEELHYGFSSE